MPSDIVHEFGHVFIKAIYHTRSDETYLMYHDFAGANTALDKLWLSDSDVETARRNIVLKQWEEK